MSTGHVYSAHSFPKVRIIKICFIKICILSLFAAGLLTAQQSTRKAWTILDSGVHDSSAAKRAQAVSTLGLIVRDPKAAETAERALEDSNSDVQKAAIAALGEMGSRASLPKIKALLRRSDARNLVAIAAALKKLNDPLGYEIYYEILTGRRKTGGSIFAGLENRKTLEKMGFEEAVGFIPFGGIGLGAYDYIKQNTGSSDVDAAAATALALDPDPATEKALVQASFGGKEIVQLAALRALAKRGDPTGAKQIEPAMYSGNSLVSYTAAAVVVQLSSLSARR